MQLINTEVIHHPQEAIEDWDMDHDSTVKVTVVPFNIVVNYDVGEEAEVVDQIKSGLETYIEELRKQVIEL
jgi:hypothetical protein